MIFCFFHRQKKEIETTFNSLSAKSIQQRITAGFTNYFLLLYQFIYKTCAMSIILISWFLRRDGSVCNGSLINFICVFYKQTQNGLYFSLASVNIITASPILSYPCIRGLSLPATINCSVALNTALTKFINSSAVSTTRYDFSGLYCFGIMIYFI